MNSVCQELLFLLEISRQVSRALYRAHQGTHCINTAQIHWRDAEGFEGESATFISTSQAHLHISWQYSDCAASHSDGGCVCTYIFPSKSPLWPYLCWANPDPWEVPVQHLPSSHGVRGAAPSVEGREHSSGRRRRRKFWSCIDIWSAHLHDVLEAFSEGQLSLHHIELCQVPATLWVFCSKCRAKGEHVGKSPARQQETGRSGPAHKRVCYIESPIHKLTFLTGSRSAHVSISSLTSLMALLGMLLLHCFSQALRGVIHTSPWLSKVAQTPFSFHWTPFMLRTLFVAVWE